MTKVEWRLWSRLRDRKMGQKFRRQVPIGPFFADFVCLDARLIVEVDGDTHTDEYDGRRDRWLESHGWVVMHIPVQEIDEYLEDVTDAIFLKVNELAKSTVPTRRGFATPTSPQAGRNQG